MFSIEKYQIRVIIFSLSFLLILCSCSESTEPKMQCETNTNNPAISEVMDYELLKNYLKNKNVVPYWDWEKITIDEDLTSTYRVVTKNINCNEEIYPVAAFLLKTSESKDDWKIEEIITNALMIPNLDAKVFLGSFACWLREGNQIEYILHGELYSCDVKKVKFEESEIENGKQVFFLPSKEMNLNNKEYLKVHETISL